MSCSSPFLGRVEVFTDVHGQIMLVRGFLDDPLLGWPPGLAFGHEQHGGHLAGALTG